jgi:hypothetical protein
MTESTRPLADCYAAHQELFERATVLSRLLAQASTDESDLLRLGASCVGIGSRQALAARDLREAILGWSECELGDRQIRGATYRAYRKGRIRTRDYDFTFGAAIHATRARRDELLRLRRQLRQLAII